MSQEALTTQSWAAKIEWRLACAGLALLVNRQKHIVMNKARTTFQKSEHIYSHSEKESADRGHPSKRIPSVKSGLSLSIVEVCAKGWWGSHPKCIPSICQFSINVSMNVSIHSPSGSSALPPNMATIQRFLTDFTTAYISIISSLITAINSSGLCPDFHPRPSANYSLHNSQEMRLELLNSFLWPLKWNAQFSLGPIRFTGTCCWPPLQTQPLPWGTPHWLPAPAIAASHPSSDILHWL